VHQIGPDQKERNKIFRILGKNFKIEDQGTLNDYLGVDIEKRKGGKLDDTTYLYLIHLEKPGIMGDNP
jgi:hypothetical protein